MQNDLSPTKDTESVEISPQEATPLNGWAKRFARKKPENVCECGSIDGTNCSCDWNWFTFG